MAIPVFAKTSISILGKTFSDTNAKTLLLIVHLLAGNYSTKNLYLFHNELFLKDTVLFYQNNTFFRQILKNISNTAYLYLLVMSTPYKGHETATFLAELDFFLLFFFNLRLHLNDGNCKQQKLDLAQNSPY